MSKKLAIKGHSTRGKEVIQLLEMLGGNNNWHYDGSDGVVYFIEKNDKYITYCGKECLKNTGEYIIYELEEILEKYPYKVGDKVIAYAENCIAQFTIQDMRWNYELNKVEYKICSSWCDTSLMQPYKEETIEESTNKVIFEGNSQSCDIMNDIIKKDMEQIKIDIPEGYKFDSIDDNNKIVLTKIQPQYPKTYEECCEQLSLGEDGKLYTKGYKAYLIQDFQKLLICRDAYWNIAGEQMGLGKPWKPDWNLLDKKYNIYNYRGNIKYDYFTIIDRCLLVFPTKQMRDTFYENFKDLIEQCKELL